MPHILVRVINAITLSANEEELRTAVKQIAEETELDNKQYNRLIRIVVVHPPSG